MKGLIFWLLFGSTFLSEGLAQSQHQRWVAAYWTNWNHSPSNFQELLSQNAFTHVIHFAIGLNSDGTFFEDPYFRDLTIQSAQEVPAAHAAGVKVIICCFPGSLQIMQSAMSAGTRATMVHNVCNLMRTYGYDGIDWDVEVGLDSATWNPTMRLLKDSLNAVGAQLGRPLTNSVWTYGSGWNQYRGSFRSFDRIHICGYEMTGAWQGWIVWNGYGIYSRGVSLPCYPSIAAIGIDSSWANWLRIGVPDSVLLYSQAASGRAWIGGTMAGNVFGLPTRGGATQQGDVWTGSWPPDCGSYNGMPVTSGYEIPYRDIVMNYAAYPTQHDTLNVSASKSVDNPNNSDDQFLTFPDPWAWWKDWQYMRHSRNGGGMSMWDPWKGRISQGVWSLVDALKLSISDIPLSTATQVGVSISSGWNLISNPVTNPIPGDSVKQLYPTSMNAYVYEFSGGYVQRYRLEHGKGYWGKFPAATTNTITGERRTRDSISVVAGWNLVGTISGVVDTGTIVSVPPGLRGSTWFGYSAGYGPVTQLTPGKGYWIKANSAGKFVLANGSVLSKPQLMGPDPLAGLNSLTITDSRGRSQTLYFGADVKNEIPVALYDMPPLPPVGAFDARFSTAEGGSMVRTHALKASDMLEFPVMIQSNAYPLIATWKMNVGTASYELTDGLGGRVFSAQSMNGEGSMKIMDSDLTKFSVRLVGDSQLPKAYALSQNYPNPFNPSTTIKYDLPKDSRVSLKLFNIIGQEVLTLVNEEQKAGYKSVQWNANNFASGVYFYRIQAGDFVASKKLLLLK
jgi:GH18 family chitinase